LPKIATVEMAGNRSRGQPRKRWAQDIADWMGLEINKGVLEL